jgi:hypothetical protein
MIDDNLKVTGQVSISLYDQNGNLKDGREVKNLVVNNGRGFIASRMISGGSSVMSHMALGSGTTAPAAGDTALESLLGVREILDSSINPASGIVLYTSSFEGGDATGAVTEAGIFNAASGGTMLCRTTFDTINKSATDTLSVTWTITIS